MNCEHCGGNLSLETLTCPYCGTVNKHAQQHVRDMNYYKDEFAETQSEVYQVTKKYTGIVVRAVAIVILIILTVTFAVLASESYTITMDIKESKANRNFEKYSAIMDQYLAEEDYLSFHAFCEANCIRGYNSVYQEYYQIISLCAQYKFLYQGIMDSVIGGTEEYSTKDNVENQVEQISRQLESFYGAMDIEHYKYYEGVDSEEKQKVVTQIESNLKVLLQTYCGLTEEDIASFNSLSDAQKRVLLEERMINAE